MVGHATVRETEEVQVRVEPEGGPGGAILGLADRGERLPGREPLVGDQTGLPTGRHDRGDVEVLALVHREGGPDRIRVVVGMRDHDRDPRGHGSGGRSSSGSRPTVSPGRVMTARAASSTPGMNELRSVES